MVRCKKSHEIEKMRQAGIIVGKTHKYLQQFIKEGITTKELDKLAEDYIISLGSTPSFKGLYGFPGCICISVNEEIVHGIPGKRILKNGDIVKLDIGASYQGYHGDSAWSYPVGEVSKENQELLDHTKESLFEGLSVVKAGVRLGDVSNKIQLTAQKYNLGVVKELVGHGIGSKVHEKPDIPNYGKKHTGLLLKEGMTFAIEPMLNLGSSDIVILDDGWTIVTSDNRPSAHYEHTIVVTKDGYEILTKR